MEWQLTITYCQHRANSMNTDLTKEQKDYAVFLPALSGFYATFVGKQRFEEYVDYNRIPYANGMESINWLNKKDGLFNYHWTLYSAGHADLDINKEAKLAEARPLPREETTPPVIKINLGELFYILKDYIK